MTSEEIVTRARSCIGKGCHYKLGKGGMHPDSPSPWTDQWQCDCSGFALWCLGQSRQKPDGTWLDTTRIVEETKAGTLFVEILPAFAKPGDLIVYGDKDGGQGHVGVVASVDGEYPKTVIHCSRGNDMRTGDAIRETTTGLFRLQDAIVARYVPLEVQVNA